MQHNNDRATIGDNNPPSEAVLALSKFSDDLNIHLENAKPFLDGAEIISEAEAELVQRIIDDNKNLHKKMESARKKLVKPLDDEKKEIQEQFNPWIQNNKSGKGKLVHIAEACEERRTAWLRKQELNRQEAERKLKEEAEKAEKERLAALENRQYGDIDSKLRAEQAIDSEKSIQSALKRVQNTRVGTKVEGRKATLREIKTPEVISHDLLLLWIQEHRIDDLNKFCEEMAAKEFRAKNYDIYGVKVNTSYKSW